MARTELIFFSTYHDSIYGTLRGVVSFIPMCLLFSFLSRKYITSCILSLVICSAIGVQLPQTMIETILYNMLVGMCISSCYICLDYTMSKKPRFGFGRSVLFVVMFTTFITILGVLTRLMSMNFDLYRS